jgi:hypothetical protein
VHAQQSILGRASKSCIASQLSAGLLQRVGVNIQQGDAVTFL